MDHETYTGAMRLGLVCLTNAPRFVRDTQAGAARLTHADVHAFDASSKRERCRDTDGTDRDDFAGIRDVGFQRVTTDVSISDESRQSRRATPAPSFAQPPRFAGRPRYETASDPSNATGSNDTSLAVCSAAATVSELENACAMPDGVCGFARVELETRTGRVKAMRALFTTLPRESSWSEASFQ